MKIKRQKKNTTVKIKISASDLQVKSKQRRAHIRRTYRVNTALILSEIMVVEVTILKPQNTDVLILSP